jgi:hypothetical protein
LPGAHAHFNALKNVCLRSSCALNTGRHRHLLST